MTAPRPRRRSGTTDVLAGHLNAEVLLILTGPAAQDSPPMSTAYAS
ncbi:MAG TPA: hypothetical protein VKG45_10675 [Actinomycetes bacterium]|nr:hypothetical protein [Actinomycetes bacterium]